MIKKERKFMKIWKKFVLFLATVAMLVNAGTTVMAGSINEYEAELIAIGEGIFEYNGVEYVATDAAKQRVYNYLMQNDVNLSASQANEAKSEFWGNIAAGISNGYLVPLNPTTTPNPDSGNTPDSNVSGGNNTAGGTTSGGVSDAPVEDTTVKYTYTEMSITMYAKQAVNVRNLPGTNGARIGSLSADQKVTVTGQCVETGWYRILYNGIEAYVSNNYLTDTVMEEKTENTEEPTEIETETQNSEIEQVTENVEETEASTDTEITEDTESEVTSEVETETEVVLREKHFNKGLNMTAMAMIIGGIALVVAAIIVISHKKRRY